MSLQQQIGQTERALERLLVEVILVSTPLRSTADWIAVNVLADLALASPANWIDRIAGTARIPHAEAEGIAAHAIEIGFASDEPAGVAFSPIGQQALREARSRIAIVTAELDARIPAEDRAAAQRVLASVRELALSIEDLSQLAALGGNR